jgi:homoserine O-succinyltransferase/O-acetyltransferase
MSITVGQPQVRGSKGRKAGPVRVAFVNNMPDGAFDATERQFLGLLEVAAEGHKVEVGRYTISGIARSEHIRNRIDMDYLPLADLLEATPDAVIVTGSEPTKAHLKEELYWDDLVSILHSFIGSTTSVLLSCLAAHVALELFDGLHRVRLPSKCSGVFSQEIMGDTWLSKGMRDLELVLPHSRLNDMPEVPLEGAGYDVLLRSDASNWSVASKQTGDTLLVLVQGHPEYFPSTLLREYRRDISAFTSGNSTVSPYLPLHCVAPSDQRLLEAFHEKVLNGDTGSAFCPSFPFDEIAKRSPWSWRPLAEAIYTNWFAQVLERRV